jgi:broad specificity phosphatase PhoE
MTNKRQSTRLLLTRHGQTESSRDDAFSGVIEVALTPEGLQQAMALTSRLQHEQIDAIYASPQQRALQTAAPIAQALGVAVQVREALREINFGRWENRLRSSLAREDAEELALWERGSWLAQPPGGETQQEVIARTIPCVREIVTRHRGQNVLLIAHKTVLRLLLGHLLGMSLPASRGLRIDPAGLSEVHITEDFVQLLYLNDTRHLADLGGPE